MIFMQILRHFAIVPVSFRHISPPLGGFCFFAETQQSMSVLVRKNVCDFCGKKSEKRRY